MAKRTHGKAISTRDANGTVNTALSLSLTEDFLPSPEDLAQYEIYNPGITKTLTDAFISQQNHRMTLERTVIEGDTHRANKAQWFSFTLAMSLIVAGFVLLQQGKDAYGMAAIVTAIAPLLAAFFGGSFLRYIERRAKSKQIPKG